MCRSMERVTLDAWLGLGCPAQLEGHFGCTLRRETYPADADGPEARAYVMDSPRTGRHSLDVGSTTADRLWSHWEGFHLNQSGAERRAWEAGQERRILSLLGVYEPADGCSRDD